MIVLRLFAILSYTFGMQLTYTLAAEVKTIEFQNTDRLYRLHNASEADTKSRPLVVHLHGFRQKEAAVEGRATLDYLNWGKLEKVASENGFVTAQPAALHGQWRLFSGLKNVTYENGVEVDDVAFIFAVVQELVQAGIADRGRIYLTGISDGAIMSYYVLCQEGSPFVAAVPIVGSMFEKHMEICSTNTPPGLMVIAGTNDPILPYDGWIFRTGREVSIPETMEFWRKKHQCTGQRTNLLDDLDDTDGSRVRLVEY